MCLWLANSVFLILLLLFSGESWGQSRSPNAPAPAAGPIQSFEQKKMSLEGPIEQPSRDNKDLPAVENRAQSSLGPETDDILKQKNTIKKKVTHTGVKSHLPQRSWRRGEQFNLKSESEWAPYNAKSLDSLRSSKQLDGQEKSMAPSTESFPKGEVDGENYDDYEAETMNDKVKEILKRYKSIDQIPTSILNEDPDIKDILEEYLEKRKHKSNF